MERIFFCVVVKKNRNVSEHKEIQALIAKEREKSNYTLPLISSATFFLTKNTVEAAFCDHFGPYKK